MSGTWSYPILHCISKILLLNFFLKGGRVTDSTFVNYILEWIVRVCSIPGYRMWMCERSSLLHVLLSNRSLTDLCEWRLYNLWENVVQGASWLNVRCTYVRLYVRVSSSTILMLCSKLLYLTAVIFIILMWTWLWIICELLSM